MDMVRTGVAPARFSIGHVFERAFRALRAEPVTFFGLSLLVAALPNALIQRLQVALGLFHSPRIGEHAPDFVITNLTIYIASVLLGVLLHMLVQAGLVSASIAHAEGRRAGMGLSVRAGLRAAVPLIGLFVIEVIACSAASVLLLVPAVMLYVMWSVASPALVAERVGVFGALRRSRTLTKGERWPIFVIQVLLVIAFSVISALFWLVAEPILGAAGFHDATRAMLRASTPVALIGAQVLLGTLTTALWCAVQNALYLDLRERRDGDSADHLADVFA